MQCEQVEFGHLPPLREGGGAWDPLRLLYSHGLQDWVGRRRRVNMGREADERELPVSLTVYF